MLSSSVEDRKILYKRTGPPPGSKWLLSREADPFMEVEFTIALKQRNLDILDNLFWSVSDPTNPSYGHYLSRKQVSELVSPSQETREQVKQWIQTVAKREKLHKELLEIEDLGDAIRVTASALLINKIFHTKLHYFMHEQRARYAVKHVGPLSCSI